MASRLITDLNYRIQIKAQQFLEFCNSDKVFKDIGASVFLTCTYRSGEEQNELYAQGRTKPGKIVTHAKAGQSLHNCKNKDGKPAAMAFDFAIKLKGGLLDWNSEDDLWKRAIEIGKSIDLESGADWIGNKRDAPHMQIRVTYDGVEI